MSILCIDVGIKNLSLCLTNKETMKIIKWELLNLTNNVEQTFKCVNCKNPTKFICNTRHYCKRHIPNPIIPNDLLNYNKKNIKELINLLPRYNLECKSKKKSALLTVFDNYINSNYSIPFVKEKVKCSSYTMIDISKILMVKMNDFLRGCSNDLTTVIIENQLGQQATRMMQIQAMVTQYFTCFHPNINVEYISPLLKLSSIVIPSGVMFDCSTTEAYKDRKKLAINIALHYLNQNDTGYIEMFNGNKKKDDLADSYLYCIYNFKKNV
jgi:hypothetical protein